MNGVLANADRLAKPKTFDPATVAARTALTANASGPYEAALSCLASAGAMPSNGDRGETAAPDATWIFADAMWVVWEAKSEARPEGELGADDVRETNGHLRFVADRRQQAAPGDSVVLLMAPRDRVHPSARAIAEDHVYRVFATAVVDLLDQLLRAWRSLRTRDLDTLTVTHATAIFAAEQALPSQWLPRLFTRRLKSQWLPRLRTRRLNQKGLA